MESIWEKTSKAETHPSLPGDLSADAAVIGGGLAGVLTALLLKERGVEAVVLEAGRIGSGQTARTTAKITSQHGLIYHRLRQDFGEHAARQYAEANQQAIREYRRLIRDWGIDCSLEDRPAYLYSKDQRDADRLRREADAAQSLGIDAAFVDSTDLPFPVAGAVRFGDQAQFHPLKFLRAIAQGLAIFEQTRAISVRGNRVETDRGAVTAKHIVFATHFPFVNVPGFYFARMHQERSYVLALEGAEPLDGMYLGVDADGLSFRNFGSALLIGGGGHRTGDNRGGGKYRLLRESAARLYPDSREVLRWSAQDCMTLDGVPYIGRFSSSEPDWYVATGFGKWGMTSSMVSAMVISDAIAGEANPFAGVFSPARFKPSASVKNLAVDMGQSVKGLARQALSFPAADVDALAVGHGGIVERDGEKVGVYKDEDGTVYAVSTRCPHLGCELAWNPDEKSWDCPCHGSRFDHRGNLLDGPAQKNLDRGEHA